MTPPTAASARVATYTIDDTPIAETVNPICVQPGAPLPDDIVVGTVVATEPAVPLMHAVGMPNHSLRVAARDGKWPFKMCCATFPFTASAERDCGLCCYSCFCSSCLIAEIAEQNEIEGVCGCKSCCESWCAAWAVACSIEVIGFFLCCGCGWVFSPWVWTGYSSHVRDSMKVKYGLPHDELCGEMTCSSFLPWYVCLLCCDQCAAYQMAYFMKYDEHTGKDFECCCYTNFCRKAKQPTGEIALGAF